MGVFVGEVGCCFLAFCLIQIGFEVVDERMWIKSGFWLVALLQPATGRRSRFRLMITNAAAVSSCCARRNRTISYLLDCSTGRLVYNNEV